MQKPEKITILFRGAKWRRARKPHRCDNHFWGGVRCPVEIQPGVAYIDTGESNDRAGGFGTDRWCARCVQWYEQQKGE